MLILFIVYHWFWTWRSLSQPKQTLLLTVLKYRQERCKLQGAAYEQRSNSLCDAMFSHCTREWRQTDRLEY